VCFSPDESLSRISVTSNPNSEDTSNQLPQDSYEDNLETSTQPDETIDSNKDEQISEEPQTTTLLLTDIYAMSLYYDGTMGPQTGVITVDDMVLAQDKTYEFWHGHGGRSHSYVVTAEDFKKIRSGIKVTIETDAVDSHTHTLFIDLADEEFLVPGTTREVEVENV